MDNFDASRPQESNALQRIDKARLTASEITLVRELDLTADNAGVVVSSELFEEWFRKFADEAPEKLSAVFDRWREHSPLFPKISEIYELLHGKTAEEQHYTDKCDREFKQLQAAIEKGRREGEVKGFAEWVSTNPGLAKQLQELKSNMSLAAPGRRALSKSLEIRRRAVPTAGVSMTAEEIAKRREKELEEISKMDEEGR